ncbi:hypothetical protein MSAS_03650 [Mycobacterium saskatchewanense]|uniref:Uncharacterized protein n=1 Tax=Mycobacterium saskatchewanense TaxID=220927 RepID=A0AAJ3TX26_9MYCO|nr:hypothetical protein [Mycobacterium saskatchewanense]ORW75197.1 hypothetical protein AWC23_03195 [Mycobacterium saskatchewanense]BBX61191.1 hypothetical protein MSAS_03650 [Mycobacterium saskatchewanense]
MTDPHVTLVAHHMILLAIPAFLPAIIVVAVILYVALRDRRGDRPPPALRAVDQPTEAAPRAPGGKPREPGQRTGGTEQKGD